MMNNFPETEEQIEIDAGLENKPAIILYNDDVNTFDHVISALVRICKHEIEQAEQVAWIVHTKGKCDVKHGSLEYLKPICKTLQSNGLSAVIEQ